MIDIRHTTPFLRATDGPTKPETSGPRERARSALLGVPPLLKGRSGLIYRNFHLCDARRKRYVGERAPVPHGYLELSAQLIRGARHTLWRPP